MFQLAVRLSFVTSLPSSMHFKGKWQQNLIRFIWKRFKEVYRLEVYYKFFISVLLREIFSSKSTNLSAILDQFSTALFMFWWRPNSRPKLLLNTRIKNLNSRSKFYGKTKVKWALMKPDCFCFGKTMLWLNECSLLFVLPQKFGPKAKILDSCIPTNNLSARVEIRNTYRTCGYSRILIIIS